MLNNVNGQGKVVKSHLFLIMIIGFNHHYYLRHDCQRTILASDPKAVEEGHIGEWISRIHPVYSMLFSLLSKPQDLKQAIIKVSKFFEISTPLAETVLSSFLNNQDIITGRYEDTISFFPHDIIKEYTQKEFEDYSGDGKDLEIYKPSDFRYSKVNTELRRMIRCPHGLVFIVTTNCSTNCIYCYADKTKRKDSILSLSEITQVLREAKMLGIKEIQLIGGEFFLHPQWYEILSASAEMGFSLPLISTKVPLSLKQLEKFKRFNIKLQISLDSIFHELLTDTLKVSESYTDNIINTIKLIDGLGIKYKIATVLTQKTATIKNLDSLYNFLRGLKGLRHWNIRLAFKSLYSQHEFNDLRVKKYQFDDLKSWYDEIKNHENSFTIEFPEAYVARYHYAQNGSESFFGAQCSANMSHMVILPDGKVTICEQLYWNPRFIIGDIHNNSIEEIWNSDKAHYLSNIQQKEIKYRSACSSCAIYETCKDFSNKCFANTIKAYGDENWDYPDPRCKEAPPFYYDIS